MSDDYIVRHCAPTLAGIKTGNIFTYPYTSKEAVLCKLRQINRRLGPKGLRTLPLRFSDKSVLIYLYRPKHLSADLANSTATALLERYGYNTESCEKCLVRLAQKLRTQGDFPHEIGLFLGYPAEDVRGFMDNESPKFSGEWKVYGDVDAARETFARHKKCTRLYCQQCERGKAMERLAVAG